MILVNLILRQLSKKSICILAGGFGSCVFYAMIKKGLQHGDLTPAVLRKYC